MIEDQSIFNKEQEVLLPPPEEAARLEVARLKALQPKKKNHLISVGVGVLVLLVTATIAVWLFGSQPTPQEALPTPTPYRSPDTTKLEKELLRLKSLVDEANPAQEIIVPPVIELDIDI